jgi:putative ABC transport system permease protein
MRFHTFVLRNVLRRRTRSTLTLTGIAIAVAMVVALVGFSESLKRSVMEIYQNRNVGLIVMRADALNPMTGRMDQALGREIMALDGVRDICPGLVAPMSFDNLGQQGIMVQGWPADGYMWDELKLLEGQRLSAEFHGKRGIVLGKDLAHNANLTLGSTVEMSDEKYHVVGIFEGTSLENFMAYLLLEDAQELTGEKGKITGCTVRLKDPSEQTAKAVQAEIEGPVAAKLKLTGKIRATPPDEFGRTNTQLRVIRAFCWITSFIAVIVGAIGMLNTMVMSVFERTREIGILRAIGWRPSRVMRMVLLESMLLSLGGGVVGTVAAVGLTMVLSHMPIAHGAIQSSISAGLIIEAFIIAIVVGLIGAAYPAFRAARLLPTEAIRHE